MNRFLAALILLLPSLALALSPVTVVVSQPQTSVTINDGVTPVVTVQPPDSSVLSIITAGPQGPKGDKGDKGDGGSGSFDNLSSYVKKPRFDNLSSKITQPLKPTDSPSFQTIKLRNVDGVECQIYIDSLFNIGTLCSAGGTLPLLSILWGGESILWGGEEIMWGTE